MIGLYDATSLLNTKSTYSKRQRKEPHHLVARGWVKQLKTVTLGPASPPETSSSSACYGQQNSWLQSISDVRAAIRRRRRLAPPRRVQFCVTADLSIPTY